jgi:hypothetical protein
VIRRIVFTLLSFAVFSAAANSAFCVDYWLVDQSAFPGKIWRAVGNSEEQLVHQRHAKANAAFPRAIMKVAQVAAGPEGAFYFCSGLDGCVLGLLDGRHEVLSFEFDGQIRDLSTGGEPHVVYFSVVPTPQDSQPPANGKIYRRDIWQGEPTEIATIRQADVGGNWWGTFCVREGEVFLATLESASRLFRLRGDSLEPVFTANTQRVLGIEPEDDHFLVALENGQISRTADFTSFATIYNGSVKASDVTVLYSHGTSTTQ